MAGTRRPGKPERDPGRTGPVPGEDRSAPAEAVRTAIACLPRSARVAIAFSGGLDSAVLLHAAARALPVERLLAFHVDHGLQAPSLRWAAHCERETAMLGVEFRLHRLSGSPATGESLEAWAREHRYRALASMARQAGAQAVLTAHHADDQIETFLLRLARGAGLEGLIGIEPDLVLGDLRLLRPFLGLSRRSLQEWGRDAGIAWIEDPSNQDETLLRNALRRQLTPAIDRVLPGLRRRLPDTLTALRDARDRLQEIERQDLARVAVASEEFGCCLALSAWRALPPAQRAAVLRRWLAEHGLRMPSRARLGEIVRQFESAGESTQPALRHDGCLLRRYRDLVILVRGEDTRGSGRNAKAAGRGTDGGSSPRSGFPEPDSHVRAVPLSWTGQTRIEVPEFGGSLLIDAIMEPGEAGLPATILRAPDLGLCARMGGERLRRRVAGPRRSLKNLYQEQGVPGWLRPRLPVLWADRRPVWVPCVGADADLETRQGERYRLRWQFE